MNAEFVIRQVAGQAIIQGQVGEAVSPVPLVDRAAATVGVFIGTAGRYVPIPGSEGRNLGELLDDAVYDYITRPAIELYDRFTGRYQTYQPLTAEEQAAMRRQHQQSLPITQPITRQNPVAPAATSSSITPSRVTSVSASQTHSYEALLYQWEQEYLQREQSDVDAAVRSANQYKLTLSGISDRPASLNEVALRPGESSWDATDRVMQQFTQEAIDFNRDERNRANNLRMIAFERTLPNSFVRVPSRVVGTAEQLARWLDPIRQDAQGNYVSPLLNSWDFTNSGVDPDWAREPQAIPQQPNTEGSVVARTPLTSTGVDIVQGEHGETLPSSEAPQPEGPLNGIYSTDTHDANHYTFIQEEVAPLPEIYLSEAQRAQLLQIENDFNVSIELLEVSPEGNVYRIQALGNEQEPTYSVAVRALDDFAFKPPAFADDLGLSFSGDPAALNEELGALVTAMVSMHGSYDDVLQRSIDEGFYNSTLHRVASVAASARTGFTIDPAVFHQDPFHGGSGPGPNLIPQGGVGGHLSPIGIAHDTDYFLGLGGAGPLEGLNALEEGIPSGLHGLGVSQGLIQLSGLPSSVTSLFRPEASQGVTPADMTPERLRQLLEEQQAVRSLGEANISYDGPQLPEGWAVSITTP